MANISLPQPQDYYRIAVRNPNYYIGVMLHDYIDPVDLEQKLKEIRAHSGNEIVSVEHVRVSVEVIQIPFA